MRREFWHKVVVHWPVDTRKYRYTLDEDNMTIVRLPIDQLDTTAACGPWEVVHELTAENMVYGGHTHD